MTNRTNAAGMKNDANHLSDDQLSDIIDGATEAPESPALSHLADCAVCQERLQELESTVALLHALPELEPPRSYQLAPTHALAGATEPAGLLARFGRWFRTGAPALRIATTAVALLLLSVTAIDLLVEDDGSDEEPVVQQARTLQEPTLASTSQADDEPDFAPAPAVSDADVATDGGESEFGAAEEAPSESTSVMSAPSPSPEAAIAAEEEETDDGPSIWRILQYALLIVLAWLVVTWIGYERVKKRPEEREEP